MHLLYIISKQYMTCLNGLAFDQRFITTTDEPNSKSAVIPPATWIILKQAQVARTCKSCDMIVKTACEPTYSSTAECF